jgi:hypothetical protein
MREKERERERKSEKERESERKIELEGDKLSEFKLTTNRINRIGFIQLRS